MGGEGGGGRGSSVGVHAKLTRAVESTEAKDTQTLHAASPTPTEAREDSLLASVKPEAVF